MKNLTEKIKNNSAAVLVPNPGERNLIVQVDMISDCPCQLPEQRVYSLTASQSTKLVSRKLEREK